LASSIKVKQITLEQALNIWQRVAGILMENESEPPATRVIELVARYGISAYDGQFIALAMDMGVPCVTEDRELQGKFPGMAVSMEGFSKPTPADHVQEKRATYRAHKGRRQHSVK
jgi:hypothetical protein